MKTKRIYMEQCSGSFRTIISLLRKRNSSYNNMKIIITLIKMEKNKNYTYGYLTRARSFLQEKNREDATWKLPRNVIFFEYNLKLYCCDMLSWDFISSWLLNATILATKQQICFHSCVITNLNLNKFYSFLLLLAP